jgi:hypothetical protein
MTPNPPEILRDRGRSLEDEFFRREDKRLTERLNELRAAEATREHSARPQALRSRPSLRSSWSSEYGRRRSRLYPSSRSSRWHGPMARSTPRSVALLLNGLGSIGTQRQELCSRLGSIAAPTPNFSSRGRTWSRPCPSISAQTRRLASRWGCWIERARWPPQPAVCSALVRRFRLRRRRCWPSSKPLFPPAHKYSVVVQSASLLLRRAILESH